MRLLYFISEPENESNRFGMYQQAVRSEMKRRSVGFSEISLEGSLCTQRSMLTSVNSHQDDDWLVCCPHNPILRHLAEVPGRKFAHVGIDRLEDTSMLGVYDAVFVGSHWAASVLRQRHEGAEVVVSGFPFDPEWLDGYRRPQTDEKLIAFNQPFALSHLHILEVHLGDLLVRDGYRVVHLCPREKIELMEDDRETRVLLREGQKRGLRFTVYDDRSRYYTELARAQVLVSTPVTGPSPLESLEAVGLGVTPLAPDWGPFPEYLPRSNLYPPYNLESIHRQIASPPCGHVNRRHRPARVLDVYLSTMGVS